MPALPLKGLSLSRWMGETIKPEKSYSIDESQKLLQTNPSVSFLHIYMNTTTFFYSSLQIKQVVVRSLGLLGWLSHTPFFFSPFPKVKISEEEKEMYARKVQIRSYFVFCSFGVGVLGDVCMCLVDHILDHILLHHTAK